ncbi:MAG: hypothetical protein Q9191_006217 [Dirinaria sp. TL-2023a]
MASIDLKHPATASARTNSIRTNAESQSQDSYYNHLTHQVQHDLKYQHEWNSLIIHTKSSTSTSSSTSSSQLLPRPLISGVAPRHVYIHPDDQVDMLKQGLNEKDVPVQREWVLPTHAREKWSLKKFAAVFDSIKTVPPDAAQSVEDGEVQKHPWSRRREKRVLMAVVNDDSTIVYYIVHDAIVKPRQN